MNRQAQMTRVSGRRKGTEQIPHTNVDTNVAAFYSPLEIRKRHTENVLRLLFAKRLETTAP